MVQQYVAEQNRPLGRRPATPDTQWIPIRDMFVDENYQRERNQRRVDGIIANFDPDLLGTLLVAHRKEGGYAVIDGGHRWEALRRLGYTEAPCQVISGLDVRDEPGKFTSSNSNRAQVQAWQLFRANVAGGEPVATDIKDIVESMGLHVIYGQSATHPGDIACVGAMRQVYTNGSRGLLKETLEVIKMAGWDKIKRGTDANAVLAIALFLKAYGLYGPNVRLAEKLREHGVTAILRRARARQGEKTGTLYRFMAEVMVDIYNERLSSNRLPDLLRTLPGWRKNADAKARE